MDPTVSVPVCSQQRVLGCSGEGRRVGWGGGGGSPSSDRGVEDRSVNQPPYKKTVLCFEFSLCVSQACLGKMTIFSIKWSESAFIVPS